MKEAATVLGMTLSAFKYHFYNAKTVKSIEGEAPLRFSQAELERFELDRKPQGRPVKNKS